MSNKKDIPLLNGVYPFQEGSTGKFFSQFDDPQRTFWNIHWLFQFYRTYPEKECPYDLEDYNVYAWKDAHRSIENEQK
jgi:hypothetical protein